MWDAGCFGVRHVGKVVRFDEVRGYGFVAPDIGGDDVFLHVNDLEVDKRKVKPGVQVSFEIEEGNRGKFATEVRLADAPPKLHSDVGDDDGAAIGDDYFDVLTPEEFLHIVTEKLLRITPALNAQQILEVRSGFEQLARKQGWIDA
ncbi:cold shock domain-containing protein [Mycobacterium bourgelatii]|uniref:DNA-binding protein n=1 Tax=Mycobacterium bourgelatii TaxID=1273442 RepID=A0A7I9YJC8_MYCBU|nr:cold shock domain-containing protein [Mycobacterium bourgelatii]MCV6973631.1 cold shock domain-containing protein [Mycobacterium bourgelatii]GFG88791.1 DNA-binding protein [Mycobacterium bourgelatii]